MKTFIIVGNGLAAHVLAHTFYRHQISFQMIGHPDLSQCSKVAAGIWNPVVFKRMTKSWLATEVIKELHEFYPACETLLKKKLLTQRPIIKPFSEEQEKILWQKKAKNELSAFIDKSIYTEVPETLRNCKIPKAYARVIESGTLNVPEFLEAGNHFFASNFTQETFDHSQLEMTEQGIRYKETEARHIIFCEGYLVKNNPYFSWIPLKPAKGEVLRISTEALQFQDLIFNKNGFVLDLGADQYKVGATYKWEELNELPTAEGLRELKTKITQLFEGDYTIIKHEAGVRPSSIDRRPIIGNHPEFKHIYVFNGLGTKGVMLAPYFAKKFVHFYLQNEALPAEVDIKRFYHLYRG